MLSEFETGLAPVMAIFERYNSRDSHLYSFSAKPLARSLVQKHAPELVSELPAYALVDQLKLVYTIEYKGETIVGVQDHWKLTLASPTYSHSRSQPFDYFTGVGHRVVDVSFRSTRAIASPVIPHVADILSCLLMDMQGSQQSFEEWASDFGYDTDSIKARDMYLDCQSSGYRLRKALTQDEIATLQKIFEEHPL
jgi:hypothetical protein